MFLVACLINIVYGKNLWFVVGVIKGRVIVALRKSHVGTVVLETRIKRRLQVYTADPKSQVSQIKELRLAADLGKIMDLDLIIG